jgi:hypothetical protein
MVADYGHKLEQITFEDVQVSRILGVLREYITEKDPLQPTLDRLDEEDSRLAVELVMLEIRDEDVGKAASLCINELIRRSRKREARQLFRTEEGYSEERLDEAQKFIEEQRELFKGN